MNRFFRLSVTMITSLLINNLAFNQNTIADSLRNVIKTTKTDTVKILALKDLAFLLSRNSPAEAETYCRQCIELSNQTDYAPGIIKCNNIMGIISIYKADYPTAIDHFNISLRKALEINDQMAIFKVYNNLGSIYINMSDYDNAARSFSQALAIAEKLNDKKSIAQCCNNIAVIHKDHKDYAKAMEYYQRSMELCKALGDNMLLSQVYSNISTIKFIQKNYKSAIDYCRKALPLQQSIDDLYGMGINYANLGEYYFALVQADSVDYRARHMTLDSSDYYYKKALALAIELNDEQRICNSKMGLGKISLYKKNYADAYKKFNEVVDLSKRIRIIEITLDAYSSLTEVDETVGNYKNALYHLKMHELYKDSIYTTANQNSINEMEVKYQTEKKQKEIEILNKEKALESIKNKILVGGIFVLILILGIAYIALRIRNRDNRLLKQKNGEIQKQREEIQEQANNLMEANHEITVQKEQIVKDHIKITDSIAYAQYIQSAVMPSDEYIKELLPRYFIMFRPRDVVSGDFYLVKKIDHRVVIIAADCTGHGVPGAFMSMLGIAMLNEIIQKPEIKGAAQLLETLRLHIKAALQQTGRSGEQREGMDIALCILNKETNVLNYAGAYNPLWLFRKNSDRQGMQKKDMNQQAAFLEFKADRQPAGVYRKEKPFTDHTIQLEKGDIFYIFSDGFYSQFGGESSEKMKMSHFKNILTEISQLPINRQKEELESKFSVWKGSELQIDDVLVMGVEV
jgi:serine phosphatase RsbU (regulator of sigma subunit)